MQLTLRSIQVEDIQRSDQQTGARVRLLWADHANRDEAQEWLEVQIAIARDIERLPLEAIEGNTLMQLHEAIGREIEIRRRRA